MAHRAFHLGIRGHILRGLVMRNLRHGGQRVEGKIPRAFNTLKPPKSRKLDLGVGFGIREHWRNHKPKVAVDTIDS